MLGIAGLLDRENAISVDEGLISLKHLLPEKRESTKSEDRNQRRGLLLSAAFAVKSRDERDLEAYLYLLDPMIEDSL